MPKINKTQYAILGVLSGAPCSGYDIKKYCDASISYFWNENFGHIYPVLKKMEKDGLITKKVEPSEGRPSKNVYSITVKGADTLKKWLLQPVDYTPVRSELLLKLFFARNIPEENILQKLQTDYERQEKHLNEFKKLEKQLLEDEGSRSYKSRVYWLAALRFGIYGAESRRNWCADAMKLIEQNNAENSADCNKGEGE